MVQRITIMKMDNILSFVNKFFMLYDEACPKDETVEGPLWAREVGWTMSKIEQLTERLRKISRRMRLLILFLILASPVVFALVVYGKGIAYMLRWPAGVIDLSALSGPELVVVIAIGALRPAVVWLALWPLLDLFRLFERGLIFEAINLRRLRQLGWILIAVDVADMVQRAITGPVLSLFGAAEPFIALGFVFNMAIVGLFLLVIAQVMDIGRELKEADELTI